ncbi:MAG: nucleotidyltransferase family protein [Chitinophagia bacterium]|nr:nucleotidyltransferase family protein [Chitinophagia bacterium]
MKAMLFAAGMGTRLKPHTNTLPKAMVKVGNKTLLEWNIAYLKHYGISQVVVNVHHHAQKLIDFIDANKGFGSEIIISDETDDLLETGGGLKKAAPFFEGEPCYVVMNVDVVTNLNLSRLIANHEAHQPLATLAITKRSSTRRLLFDSHYHLCGWENTATGEQKIARTSQEPLQAFAFTGIQVVSGKIWENAPFEGKFSMIDVYLHHARNFNIVGHDHTGDLFWDVGKPDTLQAVNEWFAGQGT